MSNKYYPDLIIALKGLLNTSDLSVDYIEDENTIEAIQYAEHVLELIKQETENV
jgi:hypothetical protein